MDKSIKLLNMNKIEELRKDSKLTERGRLHYELHRSHNEVVQKIIISLNESTYIAPHYHNEKAESFILLSGNIDILIFDKKGCITDIYNMNEEGLIYIEIPNNIIHTLRCNLPSVILEIKEGPFNVNNAKEFPTWSVLEEDLVISNPYKLLKVGHDYSNKINMGNYD
ncbi:WbuC family cupin fold metalloprotein [Vibrio sp.]|nr:WbuC family cupin fold metalloprotein [Vibrio sp.]